jgi:WXG100 family type VII secretion target
MTSFDVETDDLRAAVARMGACVRTLRDLADEVAAEAALLHEGWRGLAADRHLVVAGAWQGSFEEVHAALEQVRAAAGGAHDGYAAAAAANVAGWQQVR